MAVPANSVRVRTCVDSISGHTHSDSCSAMLHSVSASFCRKVSSTGAYFTGAVRLMLYRSWQAVHVR